MAVNIERELRTALLDMTAVTDLVVARIWDEWFRTDEVPAIVYEFDNEVHQNAIDGRSGLVIADVNVICRANTRAESRALAEAVRNNGTDPGTGLAGFVGSGYVTERDEDVVTTRDGSVVITRTTLNFGAWLID